MSNFVGLIRAMFPIVWVECTGCGKSFEKVLTKWKHFINCEKCGQKLALKQTSKT